MIFTVLDIFHWITMTTRSLHAMFCRRIYIQISCLALFTRICFVFMMSACTAPTWFRTSFNLFPSKEMNRPFPLFIERTRHLNSHAPHYSRRWLVKDFMQWPASNCMQTSIQMIFIHYKGWTCCFKSMQLNHVKWYSLRKNVPIIYHSLAICFRWF